MPPHPMTKPSPINTLLDWLTREFPKGKKQNFKQMLELGRIRINGRLARRLNQPVREEDEVKVLSRATAEDTQKKPTLQPLTLVYEDDDILVIDKPAGLLTSTVEGEKRATALAIVRRYVAAQKKVSPVGLIHRLDRDASGLLVFSKSHRAYKSLKTQFFKHTVERVYEALVEGLPSPKQGRIESHLLERADGSVNSLGRDVHGKGQRAITDYEVIASKKPNSILHVRLLTGRKHQIRAHLSARGHPIVGDKMYGASEAGPLQLRAIRLVIDHPANGKRTTFDVQHTKA